MTDNWGTPKWIMKTYEGWFDPCPLNPDFIVDGLNIEWKEKTFVNPPYSKPLPWVQKAIEENKKGKYIVLLLKVDCSTKWYKALVEAKAHFIWFAERLKYNDCGKTPNFPSMLVILE